MADRACIHLLSRFLFPPLTDKSLLLRVGELAERAEPLVRLGVVAMARTSLVPPPTCHRKKQTACFLKDVLSLLIDRLAPTMDKPRREAILDLGKYTNERIRVKFTGGREGLIVPPCARQKPLTSCIVTGILKGYDQLLNLVLDEVEENLQTGKP